MLPVSITGKVRSSDDYMKWDFEAHAITKNKIHSVTWYFSPQSIKPVRTSTPLKAPGYVWALPGKKKITVVVVDSKGVKGSATLDITVGKPTPPKPVPAPSPTPAPVKTPPPTPAPADPPSAGLPSLGLLPAGLSSLERGIYEIKNFNKGQNSTKVGASNYGVYAKSDILGAGSKLTKLALVAHSSTKKKAVPVVTGDGGGLANPTNNMYVARVEGLSRVLRGFSIVGSEQGHLYNGLRADRCANLTVDDVEILYIPGDAPGNPGETFLFNGQRLSGKALFKNFALIGGTGKLASAAGLGLNSTDAKVTIEGLLTKNMQQSAGIATWQQTGNIDIHGWVHDGPTRNLGAERLAADIHIYDAVNMQLRTKRGKHDATYTWGDHEGGNFKGGSLTWTFSSEAALERYLIPKRNKIFVLTNKQSVKQGIKKTARVIVAGKDRTDDLLQWAGA